MSKNAFSLAREALIAFSGAVLSLLILPAIIVVVGQKLFGPYRGGLAQFYADTFAGLLDFSWMPWTLALAPVLAIAVIRWLFRSPGAATTDQPAPALNAGGDVIADKGNESGQPERREPTLD